MFKVNTDYESSLKVPLERQHQSVSMISICDIMNNRELSHIMLSSWMIEHLLKCSAEHVPVGRQEVMSSQPSGEQEQVYRSDLCFCHFFCILVLFDLTLNVEGPVSSKAFLNTRRFSSRKRGRWTCFWSAVFPKLRCFGCCERLGSSESSYINFWVILQSLYRSMRTCRRVSRCGVGPTPPSLWLDCRVKSGINVWGMNKRSVPHRFKFWKYDLLNTRPYCSF